MYQSLVGTRGPATLHHEPVVGSRLVHAAKSLFTWASSICDLASTAGEEIPAEDR